ncbi:MAG: Fic family protein [Nanoarchaeota archaeon]|nr:Fic family protein [Nanoarchaeota archaeon]
MAYIHVKRVGERKYYTLRISVRDGKKVIIKDLCNLGSDISKIDIDHLEKKYKEEIRKSYKTIKKFLDTNKYLEAMKKKRIKDSPYFIKEQMLNIEAIKHHYNHRFLRLDRLTQKEKLESFLINFAVNSTSIEGNTITLKEANKLFREDIIPKNKTLREVNDLTNTKKTVDYLEDSKPKININLMINIHDMLLENIDQRKGLRDHDIHIFGQPFKPSPVRYVKADLELLMKWVNGNKKEMHPLALAIILHHKFENIHPFSDGNGRTGRVIMNHILKLAGYPPLVISRRMRKEYLEAMNKADISLKKSLVNVDLRYYKGLLDFIYTQFKTSYWDTFLI